MAFYGLRASCFLVGGGKPSKKSSCPRKIGCSTYYLRYFIGGLQFFLKISCSGLRLARQSMSHGKSGSNLEVSPNVYPFRVRIFCTSFSTTDFSGGVGQFFFTKVEHVKHHVFFITTECIQSMVTNGQLQFGKTHSFLKHDS